jgi:hypothetical protein
VDAQEPSFSPSSFPSFLPFLPFLPFLLPPQFKEGVRVAKWLSEEEGIAAFVLQYRLGPDGSGRPGRGGREGGRKRGREGWGEEGHLHPSLGVFLVLTYLSPSTTPF